MKRLVNLIALVLVAALTLAGCGSDGSNSPASGSSGGTFNDADVMFAQSMIPHHQQAVQMAKMAKLHASTPEVKQLADKIEAAQGPEIETMSGWLEDWGKEVPSGSMGGMDHDMGDMGDMGSGDMPGTMSDADMKRLDAATGSEFDRMWLTMMIEHHTGAIEIARTERSEGENADVIALAKKIEADQSAEITQMQDLLQS